MSLPSTIPMYGWPDCLYTSDGGKTWTPKNMFNSYQLNTMEFNGNTGWATSRMSSKGIYATYDGGATWKEEHIGREVNGVYLFSHAVGYVGVKGEGFLFNLYVPKG
ncbi:MAG: Photosynthesis system assembly factor [Flavipsychrobacter sp.]|nr:Photosynthesis system assembly factor [Flavipsychrobacter sp.]